VVNQQTQCRIDDNLDDQYCLPNFSERRNAPRINVRIAGAARSCGISEPFSCIVRDISETGARLQVECVNRFPDVFRLYLEHEDFSAECVVVWRSKTEVGVKFESSPQI